MTQHKNKPENLEIIIPDDEIAADETVREQTTPSWFSKTYGEQQPTHMAEQYAEYRAGQPPMPTPVIAENTKAYAAYRQRLEERFQTAQRLADPTFIPQDNAQPVSVHAFPARPTYVHGMVGQPAAKAKPRKSTGFHPVTLTILTAMACAIGGGAGFVAANPDKAKRSFAYTSSFWFDPGVETAETVIAKKPVQNARVAVHDASGAINSPIPLDLAAFPADADTPLALRISGLPPSAYLTKGVEVAKGEWMLKSSDFASTELIVPHTDVPLIALQVSALDEKTGAVAAPTKMLQVAIDTNAVPVPGVPQPKVDGPPRIVPVSAVPDQGFNKEQLPLAIPAPLEATNPEAQVLITKGDTLLNSGDILAARQFYLRAYEMEVTAAAFGVGQTYDPAIYTKFKIKGLSADPQAAAEWYGKAAAGGHEGATTALAQLPSQP
jgi:hypothetical protein